MEQKLRRLFDYQRFEADPGLAALIADTESRYGGRALSDDDLEMVSAAGDVFARPDGQDRNDPGGK